MRMKLYSAPNREEVLALIYREMGSDAVILSEFENEDGYEMRAATERQTSVVAPNFASKPSRAPELQVNHYRDRLKDILVWHGAPEGFADMVASSGSRLTGAPTDPAAGFSSALEGVVGFSPVQPALHEPVMLIGPPGSGKTSTAAKLIRRAMATGANAIPLVGDFDATAGGQQLAAYLQQEGGRVENHYVPDDLIASIDQHRKQGNAVVIDTPAINPMDREDLQRLEDLINLTNVEPVLVLSAEGHPLDLEESVRAFAELGIRRCIVTKLDVVRRRGGVLFALASGKVNLSHLAMTPFIGGGLIPATPNRLARILLEEAPGADFLKGAA